MNLEKQDKMPQARVLYCSATGASEPRNMGYMVRLGLWGAGTSFSDFIKFLGWFSFLRTFEYLDVYKIFHKMSLIHLAAFTKF